jgi:hypothetical protein
MASLWDVVTGRGGKNASAEQLKKQEAADKAAEAQAAKEAAEEAERKKAQKKVGEITFKSGGRVTGFKGYGKAKKV